MELGDESNHLHQNNRVRHRKDDRGIAKRGDQKDSQKNPHNPEPIIIPQHEITHKIEHIDIAGGDPKQEKKKDQEKSEGTEIF